MASPNTSWTDLVTTTLEDVNDEIVDAVTGNNAGTAWLKANGGYKTIEGGREIEEPIAFAENTNGKWYSGYETMTLGNPEEFSAATFHWKQLAVPVVSSGLELDVQNVGKAQRFDWLEEKLKNAKRTAANIVARGFFSDGTGSGGKELTGVRAMLSLTPTTGTYGNIDRSVAANAFWRNKATDTGAAPSASTIQGIFNTMYYSLVRGSDKPNLIICDSDVMGAYEASIQDNQRFTDPKLATLGFDNLKYKSAVVVMDGNCTDVTAFFLNTTFMKIKVAARRNFKALPKRLAFNQDAEAVFLAAALNLTCSNPYLMGRIVFDA